MTTTAPLWPAPDVPPPTFPSARSAAALRGLLHRAGYAEAAICENLGVADLRTLRGEGGAVLARRAGATTPQGVLLRLFFAGLTVPAAAAESALGAEALATLAECRLLRENRDGLQGSAQLAPYANLVLACDRLDRHGPAAADFVLGPGPATQNLAVLTVRRPVAHALDLGCGSGALALLAAAHSDEVVGVDINPRAIAFARFNATLNAVDNVSFLEGDLFAPVQARRFDLIVCNPPYVISPDSTFTYRDGEPGLCGRIVREACDHLSVGGTLQMICNWPHRKGRAWKEDLAAWFEGGGCDAWVLSGPTLDAVAYASAWLRQERASEEAFARGLDAWLSFYDAEAIEAIGQGLVVLYRAPDRAPWLEIREAPPAVGAAGDSIAGVLEARDRAARTADDTALLGLVLAPAPGLERQRRSASGSAGWSTLADEVRLTRGYRFAARLDPVAAALVGAFDGKRTAAAAAAAFAASAGLPVPPLLEGLPDLVRRLMWLGLLLPATEGSGRTARGRPGAGT